MLYDIAVPFPRLVQDAHTRSVFGIEIKTASLRHLRIMKEKAIMNRDDFAKRTLDEIDLAFIEKKLAE